MIYTTLTKKAMKLCFEAHKDQKDRTGLPYVFHPFHLAEQMKDEYSTAAALLHDVVEDTDTTFEDLQKEGIPEKVIEALRLLTHSPEVPYMEYVAKTASDPIAAAVKLADLNHNSDMSRLDNITDKDIQRHKKYLDAISLLNELTNGHL